MLRRTTALLLALLLVGPAAAPAQEAEKDGNTLVKARLASTTGSIVPGKEELLGVLLQVAPGCHIYWKNPGDVGMPTKVTLELPEGFTAGEVQWPTPAREVHDGSVSYDLVGEVTLVVPVRAAADVKPGRGVTVRAKLEWLVCDADGCLPGATEVSVDLHVAAPGGMPSYPTPESKQILAATRAQPAAPPPDLRLAWETTAAARTLVLEVPGAQALTFYPWLPEEVAPEDLARHGAAQGPRLAAPYPARAAGLPVEGVLAVTREGKTTHHRITTTAPK